VSDFIAGHLVPGGVDFMTSKVFATGDKGRSWFVDPNAVSVVNNGKTPKKAFTTMEQAFNKIASGDIIYFVGKLDEELVTPEQVFDVTVVGCGNRPRHADSTPTGGQYAAAQWGNASGTAAQATVRVIQQGWRFVNILFTAVDTNAAMIELVRNAASGNSERDASHAEILDCRFAGAGKGIRFGATSFTENVFNVLIKNNKFNSCTYGIHNPSGSQANSIEVVGNVFQGSTNAITAQFQNSRIYGGNIIQGFTAASSSGGIDLRNGGGTNIITGNYLGGTYSNAGGYNGESGDEWAGNWNTLAGGITVSDPG